MGKKEKKQKEILGIEKLITCIDQIQHENKRLTRDTVNNILLQIVNEVPYSFQIIPVTLGDNLLSDAPQSTSHLELNEIILSLAKAIFVPAQKDSLANFIQTYRQARKKTEKEYASFLLENILAETNFSSFPVEAQPALKELSQLILEKIINEKQLRQMSGYRLQPLIEITESFLYKKPSSIEIEKIKTNQLFSFRKFINSVSQISYEKITDEKKLSHIRKEKADAFAQLKKALADKIPSSANIKSFQEMIIFLQKDQSQHFVTLKNYIDSLFKTIKETATTNYLLPPLSNRIHDKLRKTFRLVNVDIDIYNSEDSIKKSHETVLTETKEEAKSLVSLINIILSIQENYNKKFLHFFLHQKILKDSNDFLIDLLLGKLQIKRDPITAAAQSFRIGGYPQKNIVEIYNNMITYLENTVNTISGTFSQNLKEEIISAITLLRTNSKELRTVTHTPITKKTVEPVIPFFSIEQSEAQLKALVEAEKTAEKEKTSVIEEQFDLEPPQEKMEPKPLIVEEWVEETEPPAMTQEKTEPEISDKGTDIIKNYQLGAFEKPIIEAWKILSSSGTPSSDNEVRLYVMCDLAQQISSIVETNLLPEQKEALNNIKSQLIDALKNPMEESSWDYFEGSHRDIIDGVLMSLS